LDFQLNLLYAISKASTLSSAKNLSQENSNFAIPIL
jgi:hypothetical protein